MMSNVQTPDLSAILKQNLTIKPNDKYYWTYQYLLARHTIVPQLLHDGVFQPGYAVAEIGCAEAGVLTAFIQAGAEQALGTDIETGRLEHGKNILHQVQPDLLQKLTFSTHNVLFDEPQPQWQGAFDLVILRDVIEHLDDTLLALQNIRRLLKPGGSLFIEFPPYTSPFGGHQHLLKNFWGKIPYIHLLPRPVLHWCSKSGWHPVDIEEVRRLKTIALTPKKFLNAAYKAGYTVTHERYYLLRPVYAIKFGLPVIPLTFLRRFAGITALLSMEANYVLKIR